MRALLISFMLGFEVLGAGHALAQTTPFNMSPDKPSAAAPAQSLPQPPSPGADNAATAAPFDMQLAPPPAPATSTAQAPTAAPFDMNPQGTRPSSAAPRAGAPASVGLPQPTTKPSNPNATTPVSAALPSRGPIRFERPILPFENIRFEGETDTRSWAFHLTQDEAASGASISVGYQNAVVVMPEASRLRAIVNGESVVDIPIASSQTIQRVIIPIRAGLLRTGQNIIRMEAVQRHRTDCTVRATYELWTDVDAASTKLIFADGAPKTLRSLEDLPAIGLDTTGVTTIRVIAPRIYRPEIRDRLLRLVQLVALRGRYAHPVIRVMESDPGPSPVGTIKVFMGLASELRGTVAALPDAAAIQPLAIMMQEAGSGAPSLIVSGPSWGDLDTAINIVGAPVLNAVNLDRDRVDTASWLWPEVPTYFGNRSIRFAELGVPTQEFSGRRLRSRFAINLPSDFFATDYGEATLYLDSAHTSSVKPGSHVDIYVNGRISATMTITSRGNIFRRQPIRIPMKNFKPGINQLSFEAVLLTDADDRCAPGETLSETNRFVLFDTTSLSVPDFGRMGRRPDLASLSTGSFPFGDLPATVVLARPDPLNYAASGTLLARMARDAGAPVRAQFANAAGAGDQSIIFVGAVDQLPVGMLARVNLSENLRTLWQSTPAPSRFAPPAQPEPAGQQVANADFSLPVSRTPLDRGDPVSTDEVRRRWADTLQRRGIIQQTLDSMREWMEQTFNLSLASLSLEDKGTINFEPSQRVTLVLAQSRTEGSGTWTLVTARTEETLAEEMVRLTDPILWSQVSGRAAALDPNEARLEIQPTRGYTFVQTQPFSLLNLRLVAANWMSTNILQYALLIVACCVLLGFATYLLLSRLGRQS
ncbi:cellulose biosynthesis cyclic di-GMP-binding regulatory protein BcsB [Microvirga alba]|uniref:Cyclic di-GMP-binding protein n=1 Tax=Microvirga alba TaxID=2791025 RepID=A0A931BYL1_9HYPH|nr:cellulose biosynthesis cyclic di-GMP-binding regulatory protein BcsB [Microvirga alba]MBF9235202.1 cellulose biosynthesis cyclic di-GMP-binding regulatory protein BcsB [Microvirga alba]